MALTAIGISFVAAVFTFISLAGHIDRSAGAGEKSEHVTLAWTAWEWMNTNGGRGNVTVPIELKFYTMPSRA